MAEWTSLLPMIKSTFRLPEDLHRRRKIQAIKEGRPTADLLIDAIELWFSRGESDMSKPSDPAKAHANSVAGPHQSRPAQHPRRR